MADIFLSYANEDANRIKRLVREFEKQGWSVWWDYKIPPGKTFDQVIEEEIGKAKCVVVVWSAESVSSEWIKSEADEGARRRILAPVLIDNVTIPLGFRRIEAAKLHDWRGDSSHPELKLLLESVKEILGRSPDPLETVKRRETHGNNFLSEPSTRRALIFAGVGAGVLLALIAWMTRGGNSDQTNLAAAPSPAANQTTPSPIVTPTPSPTPQTQPSANIPANPTPAAAPPVITVTPPPAATPHLNPNAVRRFYFIYLPDDPQRRERHDWWRADETTWIERFPNGDRNYIQVVDRITVDGDAGTLLRLSHDSSLEYYIPDKGSRLMWVRARRTGGPWGFLGEMKDVE